MAADFYKPPYEHYPEVPEMLKQQVKRTQKIKRKEEIAYET